MTYKTKPYLVLGILRRFWREYEIEGGVLRIKRLLAGPIEVPLPPSAVEVKQGPLRKLLGLGDVVIRAMDGQVYVCDKVVAVKDFVSALRHPSDVSETDRRTRGPKGVDGNIPIKFATGQSLEQSKSLFAATTQEGELSPVKPSSDLTSKGNGNELYEVIAECDASRSAKGRFLEGSKTAVIKPSLLGWSPDGSEIVTACDAHGIMRWTRNNCHSLYEKDASIVQSEPVYMFWASGSGAVLVVSLTAFAARFGVVGTVHLGDGPVGYVGLGGSFEHGLAFGGDGLEHAGLNRHRGFSPWRPDAKEILITGGNFDYLKLIDLSSVSGWRGRLEDLPSRTIDLSPIVSKGQGVQRYVWHPNGKYVAVTTSIGTDSRQVHVIRVDDAEIVASTPPGTSSLGWSPGGRMLLLKKWDDETRNQEWGLMLWDSHCWQAREFADHERTKHWIRQLVLASARGWTANVWSVDGQKTMSCTVEGEVTVVYSPASNFRVRLPKVSYAAWSPTDPNCLATVGGDDAPHSLRIWRLRDDEVDEGRTDSSEGDSV